MTTNYYNFLSRMPVEKCKRIGYSKRHMAIVKANQYSIKKAAEIIKSGGIAAFPTETVYGLGADAFNAEAVKKIFVAKGRPADNPLIVHIARKEDLELIVQGSFSTSSETNDLIKKFWPGPLTLVLKKKAAIPDAVSAGLDTVAVRMPDHKIARALIKAAGVPIAAPSANISGRPSPTSAQAVFEDFGDSILILDGGYTEVGVESTVLDLTMAPPEILRHGAVTLEQIVRVLGEVNDCVENVGHAIKSPGMQYRHYAPKAPLVLASGTGNKMLGYILEFIREHNGKKVGVLATFENAKKYKNAKVVVLGLRHDLKGCARNLFTSLRKFDKLKVDIIIAETFSKRGLGAAIMERLRRASE